MAIFNPPTQASIRKEFTHVGWFGLCPVYLGELDQPGCTMIERNGVPHFWFELNEAVIMLGIFVCDVLNPNYEPAWPILVGREIED